MKQFGGLFQAADWKTEKHVPVIDCLDQNKAVVLDPGSVDEETLMEAAESCPENAIIVDDDEGNQLYP